MDVYKNIFPTLFESCAIHFSRPNWRSVLYLSMSPTELDNSAEFCRHFRRCLIKSVIAPMIATEGRCFALRASSVMTLTMLTCIWGCLATFLCSTCFTKIAHNRWDFSPGIKKEILFYLQKSYQKIYIYEGCILKLPK